MLKYRDLRLALTAGFTVFWLAAQSAPKQAESERQSPDSTVFIIGRQSLLEVHAGKSGLLSGLGHEHRVRAHAFSGTVVYFPADPARCRVTVTVLTDSLRVVPEADSADIPAITRSMREKTLRVDSFPEITFVSRAVAPRDGGGLSVGGDLTMVGVTRPVTVDMALDVRGDTLRAEGSFQVKQTDFGIKPFSKALGMVKVKDEVRFELRIVATALPPPPGER